MQSFVHVPASSHFPLHNLPYGIFTNQSLAGQHHIGVAIGEHVLDLAVLSRAGLLQGPCLQGTDCFKQPTLNSFMGMGKAAWQETRSTIMRLLSSSEGQLRDNAQLRQEALLSQADVQMQLPAHIGDYTDFYASKEHASHVGEMFRGRGNELQPNWLHLPVGYCGRSSSIVVSGTPVRRPWGQLAPMPGSSGPSFQPSQVLDFELEMAAFVGPGNPLGDPISIGQAADHIFGFVLMNDWSARDIQKWEYVPLGPFNGKNWATTISPWVVTPAALEPFKCSAPEQQPAPLPHLQEHARHSYDINLAAEVLPQGASQASTVTRTNFKHLYWTAEQMIAHHTAGGCSLRPGDLLGTGTISTQAKDGMGSLLELTWNGRDVLSLSGGVQRTFLEDGDAVTFRGICEDADGHRLGFGKCTGRVLPAINL